MSADSFYSRVPETVVFSNGPMLLVFILGVFRRHLRRAITLADGQWVLSFGPSFDCDSDNSHITGIDKPGDQNLISK